MHLRRLRLQSFRNLKDRLLELPSDGVAVVGPNAHGKTNLLEAIYYLEILRSFRGARDAELVRFGAQHFRIEATMEAGPGERPFEGRPQRTVAAAWQRDGRRKKVTVDGAETPRLADAVGHVGAVLFSPADLALVNEGPHVRRRFLDIVLSLNDPSYLEALQRFRQALGQRNAALRAGGGGAGAWDALLVREGARIALLRGEWLRSSQAGFAATHREIAGGGEAFLVYEPGIPGLSRVAGSAEETAEAFRRALEEAHEREARLGTTVVGPHRDEVRIELAHEGERLDLRTYGSGGQRRSAALALRLLEASTLRERRGREPLLLMDDVFAELDEDRSSRLLELLERTATGQVVLTAPKEVDVRFRSDRLPRWTMRDGEVLDA